MQQGKGKKKMQIQAFPLLANIRFNHLSKWRIRSRFPEMAVSHPYLLMYIYFDTFSSAILSRFPKGLK